MKILKEAKEDLPVSFLTDFISNGWETIGYLKADIEAISANFKGTKNISNYIQDLIDAYLICIGQMQNLLQEDNYIDFPKESKLEELPTAKLEEDVQLFTLVPEEPKIKTQKIIATKPIVRSDEVSALTKNIVEPVCCELKAEVEDDDDEDYYSYDCRKPTLQAEAGLPKDSGETFEYFVDFDEPDLSTPVDTTFFDRMTTGIK